MAKLGEVLPIAKGKAASWPCLQAHSAEDEACVWRIRYLKVGISPHSLPHDFCLPLTKVLDGSDDGDDGVVDGISNSIFTPVAQESATTHGSTTGIDLPRRVVALYQHPARYQDGIGRSRGYARGLTRPGTCSRRPMVHASVDGRIASQPPVCEVSNRPL